MWSLPRGQAERKTGARCVVVAGHREKKRAKAGGLEGQITALEEQLADLRMKQQENVELAQRNRCPLRCYHRLRLPATATSASASSPWSHVPAAPQALLVAAATCSEKKDYKQNLYKASVACKAGSAALSGHSKGQLGLGHAAFKHSHGAANANHAVAGCRSTTLCRETNVVSP